eukprot:06003.XXX_299469_299651_1 [CDS] Oithona nana genome sequencing.
MILVCIMRLIMDVTRCLSSLLKMMRALVSQSTCLGIRIAILNRQKRPKINFDIFSRKILT